jgi:hypothetical protein
MTKEEEIQFLRNEAQAAGEHLEHIQKRLDELEKSEE